MLKIKTLSIGVSLAMACLTLSMVFISWYVTQKTALETYRLESETLPEISTALNLSEGVAQLAAISPSVANAGRPFLLQNERKRLEQKFNDLTQVAANLQDNDFRIELQDRLTNMFDVLNELIKTVETELFIREDVLALRFDIDDLTNEQADELPSLDEFVSTLILLIQPESLGILDVNSRNFKIAEKVLIEITDKNIYSKAERLLFTIRANFEELSALSERKPFMIASIRAQSEQLTS